MKVNFLLLLALFTLIAMTLMIFIDWQKNDVPLLLYRINNVILRQVINVNPDP